MLSKKEKKENILAKIVAQTRLVSTNVSCNVSFCFHTKKRQKTHLVYIVENEKMRIPSHPSNTKTPKTPRPQTCSPSVPWSLRMAFSLARLGFAMKPVGRTPLSYCLDEHQPITPGKPRGGKIQGSKSNPAPIFRRNISRPKQNSKTKDCKNAFQT